MMIPNTSKLFLLFFICTTFICLSSSSSFPTQYSIMGPNLDRLPSPDQAIELFLQWVREYGRTYKNLDELEKKFENFLDNLKYISASNAARSSSSYRLGLNEFADWSREEFKEVYLHDDVHLSTEHYRPTKLGNVSYTASSLDWREKGVVTPVKNQKSCGSCWAFAAAAAIEGIHAIETGRLISLSDQEILDCAVSNGCNGGKVRNGYEWVVHNGIASEADYPYTAVQGPCRAREFSRSANIWDYVAYIERSDDALLSATIRRPITVSVDASDFQLYVSGIFDGPNCNKDSTSTNHAVLAVGFDSKDGQDYWIVKNSWGTGWGMDGYIWIKRNTGLPYGVCAVNAWATYPIRLNGASPDESISSL